LSFHCMNHWFAPGMAAGPVKRRPRDVPHSIRGRPTHLHRPQPCLLPGREVLVREVRSRPAVPVVQHRARPDRAQVRAGPSVPGQPSSAARRGGRRLTRSLVGSRHPGPLAQRERVSLTRRRSLVQIQYGPPVWRENSNASNSPRGPFRGPSSPSRAKRSLSSPRLNHWYGSLLSCCCPGNDNEIRRSARYSRGAARRLTISRTWLADTPPPCRVQNSRWRPLTPSQGRSASQSCTTGDSTVVRTTVPARSPLPCRTRTVSRA
jgi:hypothetical protein